MSDTKTNDIAKKLIKINAVIIELDPAIRSAAFNILSAAYFNESADITPKPNKGPVKNGHGKNQILNKETFFENHGGNNKPSRNVHLIAAWLYSQHGVYPITIKDIKSEATNVGLTIPDDIGMTIKASQKKGKKLFRYTGVGHAPTVHGESFFKSEFGVSKGTKPRVIEEPE